MAILQGGTAYTVKPRNFLGSGGFQFDIEKNTQVELSSDITDYFMEDNTAAQDHIAKKPVMITLTGLVGELKTKTNVEKPSINKVLTTFNRLNVLKPTLSPQIQQQANKIAAKIDSLEQKGREVLRKINDLNYWNNLKQSTPHLTFQQQAFLFFEQMWNEDEIFIVETPYRLYDNMAIMNLIAIQDETTKMVSDFTLTLKQVNFTGVKYAKFDAQQFAGTGRGDFKQVGKTQGKKEKTSLLFDMFGAK
jgi:hypothetical protein